MTTSTGSTWALRGLLAVLLFFCGEILLWTGPLTLSIGEWALRVIGYGALATLALDLMARYRIRNVYGVMMVTLITTSLTALLVNPQGALIELPDHIITRSIGGYGGVMLEAFGLWLLFTGGHIQRYQRRALGFSFPVGVFAAIWARDAHTLQAWTPDAPTLTTVVMVSGLFIALIIGIVWSIHYRLHPPEKPQALIMNERELAALSVVFAVLAFIRILQTVYSGPEFLVLVLVFFGWLVLWFEHSPKGRTLLDQHVPPQPLPWTWLLLLIGLFYAGMIFGWVWPSFDIGGYNSLSLIELAFTLLGFTWLPLVMVVTAARALDRQGRKLEIL